MIQDIFPMHLDNSFEQKQPDENGCMAVFYEDCICLKDQEGKIQYPRYKELKKEYKSRGKEMPGAIYLFSIDQEEYFLLWETKALKLSGFCYYNMFQTRSMRPRERILAAATAWHLYVWYRDNRFCSRCKGPLLHSGKQRMLECTACGNKVFPQIAPAVIVGVTDGTRILMTKYANREYKRYALIAGFTEIGETAEETVAREVMEEVGIRVKNIRYYKSQPWGYDSNLLLGYFCELDGAGDLQLDEEELAEAEWVPYDQIENDPEGISLTREMMLHFREHMRREWDYN